MSIGRIEVICGPMSSGKSEELMRRLRRQNIAGRSIVVFKPHRDARDGMQIKSRSGVVLDEEVLPLHIAKDAITLFEELDIKPDIVAIDEAQFLDQEITPVVRSISLMGIDVIIAGLDKNFKGEPFGPMPQLLAIADRVFKLNAVCMKCKDASATYTYRKTSNEEEVVVGGDEAYEARCGTCWMKEIE